MTLSTRDKLTPVLIGIWASGDGRRHLMLEKRLMALLKEMARR